MNDNFPRRKSWLAVNSHGWEDFPVHHVGHPASELLSSWSALWHPLVLLASGELPRWNRLDDVPDRAEGSIAIVPAFLEKQVSQNIRHKLEDLGGTWLTGSASRQSNVASLIQLLETGGPEIGAEVVGDFFSFGYCYLQVQLMTRQLRYVSTLDNAAIAEHLANAARAAAEKQDSKCREQLQRGFDLLIQERSSYYPDGGRFVDCLYLSGKTSVKGLRETLACGHAVSLQASGRTLDFMANSSENSELFATIRQRAADGSVGIIAGPASELPAPVLSVATVLRQIAKGRGIARRLFPDAACSTWGSRRFGLSRSLPGLLELSGFTSAIHATLDDGRFPHTAPNLTRWQGDDQTHINALTSMPRLADSPETWLKLSIRTGEMIESHHFATELLVHWPGVQAESYQDLVNSLKFGEVLGKFITVDQFFAEASDPGYTQTWRSDDYRDPFLVQLVQANAVDPLSRFSKYWQRSSQLHVALTLHRLLKLLEPASPLAGPDEIIRERVDQLSEGTDLPATGKPDSEIESLTGRFASRLAELLSGEPAPNDPRGGRLLINPQHYPVGIAMGDEAAKVPAWGFLYSSGEAKVGQPGKRLLRKNPSGKNVPLVVDGIRLQNPWFYVDLNPQTGGIGGICFHARRGAIVSQQLAIRSTSGPVSRKGTAEARYSQMAATRIGVLSENSEQATLESTGQLVLEGRGVGTFRQLTHLSRHEPLVKLEIEVELAEPVTGPPWQNYLCNRIAWNDDANAIDYWSFGTRTQTWLNRITAPVALQIEQLSANVALFPCGLPFHQRVGYRQLDTLLAVQGETARNWQLGLGVNVDYPLNAAMSLMAPLIELPASSWPANREKSGWLFHLNCKNVAVLDWPGNPGVGEEGKSGERSLQLLVRETEGRPAQVRLDCFRPIKQGWLCLADSTRKQDLTVVDGSATWELVAHQTAIVELVW